MIVSVLMSVYHKENPSFLRECFASLRHQSVQADEIVLIKDGPLGGELEEVISDFSTILPLRSIQLEKNVGLGAALRIGITECKGELIARMDSDDISVPDRFALQLKAFQDTPEADVIGGAISEFISAPDQPVTLRRLPTDGREIKRLAKTRNPVNHVTVMYRREAVLRAGNYLPFSDFEDYCLWARMLMKGSVFRNLDDVLVRVRIGNGMLSRRSGLAYVRSEVAFQNYLRETGFISLSRTLLNICMRVPVRIAPMPLQQLIYQNILRSS